jgi:dihydrofolate synthase / folylpolyglutamate synthase
MSRFSQLSDWLAWLETLHPQAIDLGLSRIHQVANRLGLLRTPSSISHEYSAALAVDAGRVFTVAGTNGKGSCVATIEQTLLAQHYKVGSYTSPHIHDYCERIRIDGKPVDDRLVCDAFTAIDEARGDISLTYFEFGTLAALWIFVQQQIPYIVLEVGLGGRLDAVNIVDADIAIVTSIAVDHEEWLGSDREVIAVEKLGVTRKGRPAVITEQHLTKSLLNFIQAHQIDSNVGGNTVAVINQHFSTSLLGDKQWRWQFDLVADNEAEAIILPLPTLPLDSVVAGLQALHMSQLLPDSIQLCSILLKTMLSKLHLNGRYQTCEHRNRGIVFDVAHNPAAAQVLRNRLQLDRSPVHPSANTLAVFAVMDDKDIVSIIDILSDQIDEWFIGELAANQRAASLSTLKNVLQSANQEYRTFDAVEQAFDEAVSESSEHDRIVIFGSFFTVAAIQTHSGL